MTARQAKKTVGNLALKVIQSKAYGIIVTVLCTAILGFLMTTGKDIKEGIDRTKVIPENTKQINKQNKWQLSHDSTEVIQKIKDELYKDSTRKQHQEVIKLLKEIRKDQGVIIETVEHKRIKREMDSVPILIISEPPSAEIKDPAYSKMLREKYPYATQFVIDSLLARKK